MFEFDAPLGDTEATEDRDFTTIEPLDVTATDTQETTALAQKRGGYSVGWEVAQLSYGGDIKDETFQKIHSSYNDYSENSKFYDAWKDIDSWTIESRKRERHQLALDDNLYELDENNNVTRGGAGLAAFDIVMYDMDAMKGALLAQKQGFNTDTFNTEYAGVTKSHTDKLAEERIGTSAVEYIAGSLAGHILQPETAIDFMSPGKIMGSTIAKGAAKAFATEAGFAFVGETIREQRIREHMERANLEYTLWDSVENILINSGLAGAVRGIGSAVIDARTLKKIDSSIIDKTDKEIFARYAQRENSKLTSNTNNHIKIVEKAKEDINNGKDVDVADFLEIDINTKVDDAVEEVNINEELALREAESGYTVEADNFVKEFDETPPMKEVPEDDIYDGMATPQEADDLIAEMGELDPEIRAEFEAIQTQSKQLSERAQQIQEAAVPKIGGSEDEAKAAVKDMFKKKKVEAANRTDLSKEDIVELEKMYNDNEVANSIAEAQADGVVFSKGADNLIAGTIAGVEEDENGNITFSPEKFVLGLGGYTALKKLVTSPTIQKEFKEYIGRVLNELEGNPKFDYLTGTQRVVESGKPLKKMTREELEHIDTEALDKEAFGVNIDDKITLDTKEIKPTNTDIENAEYKYEQGGMKWVRSVDFSEPIEIYLKDGQYHIEDGHHRWFAAKKLKKKINAIIVDIKNNPIDEILGE